MSGHKAEEEWRRLKERSDIDWDNEVKPLMIPLIGYADGVALGFGNKKSIMNTKITLGIFGTTLMRQKFAKVGLGYPPSMSGSLDILRNHLMMQYDNSVTKVNEEIDEYKRSIQLIFWDVIMTDLQYAWKHGIVMDVLGQGTYRIYPFLSTMIGDHPQLQSWSSVKQGATTHGCRYCMYPTKEMVLFDPSVHGLRDYKECLTLIDAAVPILAKKRNARNRQRRVLSEPENEVLVKIKTLSLTALPKNPFLYVYSGHNSTAFNGLIQFDPFHTLLAGVLVDIQSWCVRVIEMLDKSSHSKYSKKALALYDASIIAMPGGWNSMPHIPWVHFNNGLSHLVTNTGKGKNKNSASGSMGGMRSSWSSCMVLQSLISISSSIDQIVPDNDEFNFKAKPTSDSVRVGNIKSKP